MTLHRRHVLAERAADYRAALVASVVATVGTGSPVTPAEILGEVDELTPEQETRHILDALGAVRRDNRG